MDYTELEIPEENIVHEVEDGVLVHHSPDLECGRCWEDD
jgi:hypothetical protein